MNDENDEPSRTPTLPTQGCALLGPSAVSEVWYGHAAPSTFNEASYILESALADRSAMRSSIVTRRMYDPISSMAHSISLQIASVMSNLCRRFSCGRAHSNF